MDVVGSVYFSVLVVAYRSYSVDIPIEHEAGPEQFFMMKLFKWLMA